MLNQSTVAGSSGIPAMIWSVSTGMYFAKMGSDFSAVGSLW